MVINSSFFYNGRGISENIEWVMSVLLILKLVKDFTIRIREEFYVIECVADRVILDPFPFLQLLLITQLFLYKISKLVISHNECIELLGILNAV